MDASDGVTTSTPDRCAWCAPHSVHRVVHVAGSRSLAQADIHGVHVVHLIPCIAWMRGERYGHQDRRPSGSETSGSQTPGTSDG